MRPRRTHGIAVIGSTISIVHSGTRETRAVPVEFVCRSYVTVRWGQSGVYDLNLADNVLTARSAASRRKGGIEMRAWSACDIEGVRRMVRVHCDGEDRRAVTRRLSEEHERRKADEWHAWQERAEAVRAKRLSGGNDGK